MLLSPGLTWVVLTQQMTQAEIQNKTVNLLRRVQLSNAASEADVMWSCIMCIMPQRVCWHVCREFWSLPVTSDCLSLATTWKGNCSLVNRNISQFWRVTFQSERVSNVHGMLQISLLSWRSFRDVTYPDTDLDCILSIIRMHSEMQHPHRVRKWRQEVDPWLWFS